MARGLVAAVLALVTTVTAWSSDYDRLLRSDGATWSDFATLEGRTPIVLSQYGAAPGSSTSGGELRLLSGQAGEQNVAAFDCTARGKHMLVEAAFQLRVVPGADGAGFALLSTERYGRTGAGPELKAWEEPNLPGTFAVGLDVYDPPNSNWFDENGNIEGKPEREVSLHWDGVEVANRLCPVEFRDGRWHDVSVSLRFEPGGARVTVTVDGADVYRDQFIAHMQPYESRVAVGARSGGLTTELAVDDLAAAWSEPTEGLDEPLRVRALSEGIIYFGNELVTSTPELPASGAEAARVILDVALGSPPGGFDAWDRCAAVYAWDDRGERIEIARYITPFGRGYVWHFDVTPYKHLLCGARKVGAYVGTVMGKAQDPAQQKGWKVTLDLSYYPGEGGPEPFEVVNLWSGDWDYGNPDSPLDARFVPREVAIGSDVVRAVVRITVTGHGMNPNTNNAAEFMPADRTLTVNGHAFSNLLWRDDVYLNPCRPQGGTWKFSRAGWGPGDVVHPWEIDVTGLVTPGGTATFTYIPMPYVNEGRGQARANHWVEAQLVLYRGH